MVRKKMKRVADAVPPDNQDASGLTGTVCSWLKDLDLVGHELLPTISSDLDISNLPCRTGETSAGSSAVESKFAQARGLQALRAAVAGGSASVEDLRLIFLYGLLLYIDPGTSHLRKAIKSLLGATEKIIQEQQLESGNSSMTDSIAGLVAARFAKRSWDLQAGAAATHDGADRSGGTATAAAAVRTAVSLQRLMEVPAGKRALVAAQEGVILLRFIEVLDASLAVQVVATKGLHGRCVFGQHLGGHSVGTGASKTDSGVPANAALERKGVGSKDDSAADLYAKIDCCSELLKAAACLMPLTREWHANQLSRGGSTLRRMCQSCLLLLSIPSIHRECSTHASAVLVHSAVANWRSSRGWPSDDFCPPVGTAAPAAAPSVPTTAETTATAVELPPPPTPPPSGAKPAPKSTAIATATEATPTTAAGSGVYLSASHHQGGAARTLSLTLAANTINASFFSDGTEKAIAGSGDTDGVTALLAGFMPLPAGSRLAVCRALFHILDPSVLLAVLGSQVPTEGNVMSEEPGRGAGAGGLMFGPILRAILVRSEADSGLSLRFFALQVLEVTMSALVHPAKLISSMAPVLLEHVFAIRQLVPGGDGGVGEGEGRSEPERLVGQVLNQPAASKGKYVALSVLLPRVGAIRMLELCPSLVEQLVWAVGVRGNISGQAVSLLLQFLKAVSEEQSSAPEAVVARAATSPLAERSGTATLVPAASPVAKLGAAASRRSSIAACRSYWVGPAAAALMQEDLWSRGHVAAYLLPEVFKLDPRSVSDLCLELRSRVSFGTGEEETSGTRCFLGNPREAVMEPDVRRLWALMEVARFARKCGSLAGLSVVAVDSTAGLLQLEEVKWAALHADETLRMSALSLLCADLRVTTVPAQAETRLIQEVLPYSLKVFGAQNRQLLLRAMQTLLIRMRETARVCTRGQLGAPRLAGDHKRQKKKHGHRDKGAVQSLSGGMEASDASAEGEGTPAETPSETLQRIRDFTRWLCREVLRSLYPGCPFEREVLGLEMAQLILSELLPSEELVASTESETALAKVASSSLFCWHWVDTLLALLGSSWDRSRALAYSILARFPRPLAGYEGLGGATRLAEQGLRLSGSGRQRESDQGALILRLVFVLYARGLRLRVPLLGTEVAGGGAVGGDVADVNKLGRGGAVASDGVGVAVEDDGGDDTAIFLEGLCGVLSHRLDGMQGSFDAILANKPGKTSDTATAALAVRVTPSLPHGVLLATHHVLLESKLRASGAGRSSSSSSPVTGQGRSRRGAKLRRAGGTAATAGVGGEGGAVQWERRRKAATLLLEQAFRSLRLSLLIVGENGCGDDEDDGNDEGRDICDDTTDGENPEGAVKTSRKPRSGVSVNANGHMGMVSLDTGKQTVCTAPLTGSSGNSVLDCADGAATEDDTHGMSKHGDCGNDSSGGLEWGGGSGQHKTDTAQRSAVESQRAVVGAWLLAKETCRFFSTLVAASPLPLQEEEEATGSPDLSAGASDGGKGADVRGSGSLLAAKDVTAIGETLLKTLLSLKHMGCVASAQAALQTVCEAMLHGGRRNAPLARLPSLWLDQLLGQLAGEKQEFVLRRSTGLAFTFMAILRAEPSICIGPRTIGQFVLRRSTGLAFTFMAILRAEPRSVEPVLLPRCMGHLLAMAKANEAQSKDKESKSKDNTGDDTQVAPKTLVDEGASKGDWKSTVHAMNVLRVVFVDATLADDVGPYVTEATMAAVCGFEHPMWAVRNSSMMLFASIMQRAVGGAKNAAEPAGNPLSDGSKRPHSARAAVAAEAFFQQHPKLHPFLLSELERATNCTPEAGTGSSGEKEGQRAAAAAAAARAEMHPVLYPILLLLARLKAGGETSSLGIGQAECAECAIHIYKAFAQARVEVHLLRTFLAGWDIHKARVYGAARRRPANTRETFCVPSCVSQRGSQVGACPQDAATLTESLVPAVIWCAGNPHFLARLASSRALAALVPPARAHGVVMDLIRRLPKSPADAESTGPDAHNHVHGTLLQVLELLLAVRARSNSGQPAGATTQVREISVDSPDPGSTCSESEAQLPKLSSAVLELSWLADPMQSRCPPIRSTMLQVLEVLSGFETERGRCIPTPGAVQSALHRAEEMNFSLETGPQIRPSGDRRVVPGRSVLASAVVGAVIRRRLTLAFNGCRAAAEPRPGADVRLGKGAAINPAADTREIAGESATGVVASANPGVGGVSARVTTAPGKKKGEEEHETSEVTQARYVAELLSTPDVDVRDAAIKATKKVFGEDSRRRNLVMSPQGSYLIWAGAAKALMEESHPRNVRRLVRLLARVGLHLRGYCLPPAAVDSLWKHLRRLFDGEGGPGEAQAGALEVMGVIIRLDRRQRLVDEIQADEEGGSSFIAVRVEEYASFLERAVGPAQPVVARAAAAASLVSSEILSTPAPTSTTCTAAAAAARPTSTASSAAGNDTKGEARSIPRLGAAAGKTASGQHREQCPDLSSGTFGRLWFVALSLLQDDDERVRSFAARFCSAAVSSNSSPARGAPDVAGGCVDLCAVDLVLAHLASLAKEGGACTAEDLVLNLLRVFDGMLAKCSIRAGPSLGGIGDGAAAGMKGVGVISPSHDDDVDDLAGGDGDADIIFGREERSQFQEPTLFAAVAAPYLCRALEALDGGEDSIPVFPEPVSQGLVDVLGKFAGIFEGLSCLTSLAWEPGVYQGVMCSALIGASLMEYLSSRGCRIESGGRDEAAGIELSGQVRRAKEACEYFESGIGGSKGSHPAVSEVVARTLRTVNSEVAVSLEPQVA
ncbi:conserved unknown protein [Ectocarpus siliculosus]|uniref:DUF2428 domain-containing protein n=1 Tax=Ectocarpus siliculosus TaxID=2880 RepID=D7FZE0_ECTSI|nr:conserved unknown protein [Ectocarpus siliculosus]|eukprot:CBJ32757.1 conserved unknown protein [Ectocarpus siliculosus]